MTIRKSDSYWISILDFWIGFQAVLVYWNVAHKRLSDCVTDRSLCSVPPSRGFEAWILMASPLAFISHAFLLSADIRRPEEVSLLKRTEDCKKKKKKEKNAFLDEVLDMDDLNLNTAASGTTHKLIC